ncbi:MAG TPA: protein kinase, partial [Kofleriaceae bacterium]|nr:protein kinase [Kofleriaceae bacterium]
DTRLGRRVAMKFLLRASAGVAQRFLVEARATAQCNHENIVIIHEVNEVGGMPYMVLEYLEGQTMRDAMKGALPPARAVELVVPVCRALVRAHELGILHRDLKPENIFITEAGQVKVLDFGIAKALSESGTSSEAKAALVNMAQSGENLLNLTGEGALIGTLPYMSPEQCGMGQVDHRTDLYAVGIILYEMLAGRHPIEPLTPPSIIRSAVSIDEPLPSVRAAVNVPEALGVLVDRCLRKHKEERIGSAGELLAQLEDLLPGRRGRRLAEGESPYPGLTAFQESDADRFFGRSRDIARMVARIRENPLTGVIGPSGVGKSSFIRAGVVPALKASGESWDTMVIRPGRHPLSALASLLQPITSSTGQDVASKMVEHERLSARLRQEPGYLGTLLRSWARQKGGHTLLFVDQFEELYTLVPDPTERAAFIACLSGVADDAATPLRVVVSMRSDFLDRVGENQRFLDDLSRGLVFLAPPDRAGLREALEAPIEMLGYRYESPGMVGAMLRALEATDGALPLLQFAAAKLWDARDRERMLLTEASFNAIGGVAGALATHADEVLAGMPPASQKLSRALFLRLVTPERTRAVVDVSELMQLSHDQDEVRRLLDQLVHARLLVVQKRGDGNASAEIVHESLIERWPTLRRWLDEGQEDAAFVAQLRAAAQQWDARGRPAGLLWRGEAMEEARRWYGRARRELPAREQQFLDAVLALATRSSRLKRFAVVATISVLSLVAIGASVAMVWIRQAEQEAQEQADVAEVEKKVAEKATEVAERARADVQEQLELVKQKEAERAAEAEKRMTEEEKRAAAEQQVAVKEGDLVKVNAALQDQLQRSERLREMAQKEKEKAEKAEKVAQAAYAKEKKEKEAAQEKLKTVSTTLKSGRGQ